MAKDRSNKKDLLLGLDLGGTKILAAVIDADGRIISREKKRTKGELGVGAVTDRIARCAEKAIKSAGVDRERILALGLGAPGPLNQETGVLESPPNLTGWVDVPLKTILQERLRIPVHIENDVNAGTWGEFSNGAAVGASDVVGIFIGTGIGGGLVLGGRLHRGFNRTAGELGHMVLDPQGPRCGCGLHGCYEAFASRTNVERRIREISGEQGKHSLALEKARAGDGRIRSSLLAEGWRGGDPCVRAALEEMCYYSGLAAGSLINLLSPETIVFGGGVIEALGEELLPAIRETAFNHCFENARRNVKILPAALGDDSGILGAAMLARQRATEKRSA